MAGICAKFQVLQREYYYKYNISVCWFGFCLLFFHTFANIFKVLFSLCHYGGSVEGKLLFFSGCNNFFFFQKIEWGLICLIFFTYNRFLGQRSTRNSSLMGLWEEWWRMHLMDKTGWFIPMELQILARRIQYKVNYCRKQNSLIFGIALLNKPVWTFLFFFLLRIKQRWRYSAPLHCTHV